MTRDANVIGLIEHSAHWADHAATELIEKYPSKSPYVCASGISPSGVVHIGNFREVITVDFVVRALRDRGKTVRFIYSWDDYDALRKVPKNLPNKKLIEDNLRRPIGKIPDPFGTASSYAAHFEKQFEAEINQLGITPEYIYQYQAYENGRYRKGIERALENESLIRNILNDARTERLEDDWRCVTIYCNDCNRDTTRILSFERPLRFLYHCSSCQKEKMLDGTTDAGLKLLWRIDWPMRWDYESIDFEPGGKDHSSTGGSFDTGARIARQIYQREPPVYVQYDFVLAKGLGHKLSSSVGSLITLSQALEVYEPQVIRWIFASRKPNIDFSISFDLDVMKAYDDFDRCERIAFAAETADEKKRNYESRIYDFSIVEYARKLTAPPRQFPFRHLCNVLQIHQGNLDKVANHYGIQNEKEKARLTSRAGRAWKWIADYAPNEFRFALKATEFTRTPHVGILTDVVALIERTRLNLSEEELSSQLFEITKHRQIPPKALFETVYEALIGKRQGPKLASFLIAIGPEKAASILKRAL